LFKISVVNQRDLSIEIAQTAKNGDC